MCIGWRFARLEVVIVWTPAEAKAFQWLRFKFSQIRSPERTRSESTGGALSTPTQPGAFVPPDVRGILPPFPVGSRMRIHFKSPFSYLLPPGEHRGFDLGPDHGHDRGDGHRFERRRGAQRQHHRDLPRHRADAQDRHQPERQLRRAAAAGGACTASPPKPPGFKKKTTTGIVLEVNQEPRVDIVLEVGAVTDAVTVNAEAPVLQTENAVVGQVVDNRYTTQIPLNGRDFSQLLLLSPGTTTRPGGFDLSVGSATGSNGSGIAIGGRDSQNNFTLDGASNNARQFGNIAMRPSIDAIQEFKVQTNSYTADLGQAAFGQISLITKSGTNSLHGSLFEFWRNNVFDARNTFLPQSQPAEPQSVRRSGGRPDLAQQEFLLRQLRAAHRAARRGIVPVRPRPGVARRRFLRRRRTDAEGSEHRTAVPRTIASRRTSSARRRTRPSASGRSRTSAAPPPLSQNLLVTAPDRFSDGLLTIKIDHELTGKDRLSGRYSRAPHDETTTPGLPTFEQIIPPHNQIILLNWTHIFTPALLGEFRSFVHPVGVRAAQPEHGQGRVLRSVRHQQSAGGSAVRGRAQPDLHQHLADRIRRRRFQYAAGHFERVQLCRQRDVDARQPRDQGRLHADPVSAEHARTGFRTAARQLQFPRRFHGPALRRFPSGHSLHRLARGGQRAWRRDAPGGTATTCRTIGRSAAS